jgi:hypothetical protein
MLSAALLGYHCRMQPLVSAVMHSAVVLSNIQGAGPLPSVSTVAKTGRNHLNEEITPLLPTGTGERYSQTILNLGHAALPL